MYNPNGMWRVAAGRWINLPLHSSVFAGGRPTTHQRAEIERERPLGFHLVQVHGVHPDVVDRVNPEREASKWNL